MNLNRFAGPISDSALEFPGSIIFHFLRSPYRVSPYSDPNHWHVSLDDEEIVLNTPEAGVTLLYNVSRGDLVIFKIYRGRELRITLTDADAIYYLDRHTLCHNAGIREELELNIGIDEHRSVSITWRQYRVSDETVAFRIAELIGKSQRVVRVRTGINDRTDFMPDNSHIYLQDMREIIQALPSNVVDEYGLNPRLNDPLDESIIARLRADWLPEGTTFDDVETNAVQIAYEANPRERDRYSFGYATRQSLEHLPPMIIEILESHLGEIPAVLRQANGGRWESIPIHDGDFMLYGELLRPLESYREVVRGLLPDLRKLVELAQCRMRQGMLDDFTLELF